MKKYIALLTLLLLAAYSQAQIRMPNIFGDHMVLQQQSEPAIWGWAGPMEELTIKGSWSPDEVKTRANSSGNWKTTIKTPAAGGPFKITIKGRSELTISDVLIGEVWLCSGQSNMEWSLSSSTEGATEIPNANFPEIRLFKVNRSAAEFPQDRGEGKWEVCTPEAARGFSAIGYFFGKKLHADMKVPVGLLNVSWGGTPAEVWTPKELVLNDPALKASAAKQREQPWGPVAPGVVYNSMLKPIVPFGIAGALWYQGEGNTGAPSTYKDLMQQLIEGWRADFKQEFPFYVVQIAPFKYGQPYQGVLLQEQQTKLMSVPKTGLVVVSDVVEDVGDIHPKSKKPVGDRLAALALAEAYNKPTPGYRSPLYKSMQVEKGKVRVSFDYAQVGLISRGGAPTQFLIAGEDHKFYPATVKIEGASVLVSAKEVKVPVAVRFCWANDAIPNLFNKEGLPVSAFRTDNWPE